MRILLACLMCEILPLSQAWAIDGGPFDGGGLGQVSVLGTYAGVMIDKLAGSNNLGIFTLSIPQQGLATGLNFIFTGARTFSGPITGLADPNTNRFVGTLQGIATVTNSDTTIDTLNFHADGSIRANVRGGKGIGIASIRLNGSAHVTTTQGSDPPTETNYKVRGFKQASVAGGS